MLQAKKLFEEGIIRVRRIDTIYLHLINVLKIPESDITDLLRSEIVYSVSSFDRLIHDLVRLGMLEIFTGSRIATNAYKSFSISLNNFLDLNSTTIPPPEHFFERIIVSNHKHLSFQDPDKVSEALSLFWLENHKWQKIATKMGRDQSDLKTELKNIIIRRNQIVHEGDFDLFTYDLEPLTHGDTITMVNFLEQLGLEIYALVS